MLREAVYRIENYLLYITEMKSRGIVTVTSEDLASVVGVSASRVRQDLISLHVVGKPRSGYDIAELEILLYSALDLLREKGMALIGFGNLGRALTGSGIWEHAGFALRAVLDNDRNLVGTTVGNLAVRHISELPGVIASEHIMCACLTVPAKAAQSVTDLLIHAGIKGIWNFVPVDLQVPSHVVVENQRLEQGLMTLSYLMKGR